jgi:hypothetical protein
VFPSSQNSAPERTPSPHTMVDSHGSPSIGQEKLGSTRHRPEQPSPGKALPSSHCSSVWLISPSPHAGSVARSTPHSGGGFSTEQGSIEPAAPPSPVPPSISETPPVPPPPPVPPLPPASTALLAVSASRPPPHAFTARPRHNTASHETNACPRTVQSPGVPVTRSLYNYRTNSDVWHGGPTE